MALVLATQFARLALPWRTELGWNDYYRFRFKIARGRGTQEAGSLRGVIMGFGLLFLAFMLVASGSTYRGSAAPEMVGAIFYVMGCWGAAHLAEFSLRPFAAAIAIASSAVLLVSSLSVLLLLLRGTWQPLGLGIPLASALYSGIVLWSALRRLRNEPTAQ